MRQALHVLVFGAIFLSVRSCGVNETYDRLQYSVESAKQTVGLDAAGRAWSERVYPAVVGAASRGVTQGTSAAMDGTERALRGGQSGVRARIQRAVDALKQTVRDLFGGSTSPAESPPDASPTGG